jgi:Secretion system C-terminal sorting domain
MKITIAVLNILVSFIFAQDNIILKTQRNFDINSIIEHDQQKQSENVIPYDWTLSGLNGALDTLQQYSGDESATNFQYSGHDVMVQWFEAPADLIIKSVSFHVAWVLSDTESVRVKLVKVNWDKEQIENAEEANHGYYRATENGFFRATAFLDDPESTGEYVDQSGFGPIFGEDLWSDDGLGILVNNLVADQRYWVEMGQLGVEPEIKRGEIFAIAVRNESMDGRSLSIGNSAFWGIGNSFKYYSLGRQGFNSHRSWWSRKYIMDMTASVLITSDSPPTFKLLTSSILSFTNYTTPRNVSIKVLDDNLLDGIRGTDSVFIKVSNNGWKTSEKTQMSLVSGDSINGKWSGEIPGYSPGNNVSYFFIARDINGNIAQTDSFGYKIYEPLHNTLLVFNGLPGSGYPSLYYFGHDDFEDSTQFLFDHDIWFYGRLNDELLNNYKNVIELTTDGPLVNNNKVIREWLEKDASHNYMLMGDEWLGFQTSWLDTQWKPGSFHYDIMGITFEYNDINFRNRDDQFKPSKIIPVAGSAFGDSLIAKGEEQGTSIDSFKYDPFGKIDKPNWLDGVRITEDCEVFLKGVGIDSNLYTIGYTRTLSSGNKVVFLAYDPLSITSVGAREYWYGVSSSAPQVQALKWFGIVTKLENDNILRPNQFNLSQNYPNPFNPSTIINYELRIMNEVKLVVYDVLGREVKTLVDKTQQAGKYKVTFNATGFASGVYYYKLKAGKSFEKTRKMLLLR